MSDLFVAETGNVVTTMTATPPTETTAAMKRKETGSVQLQQARLETQSLEAYNEEVNRERRETDMLYDLATNPDGIRLTAVTNKITIPLLASTIIRYREIIATGTIPVSTLIVNDSSVREAVDFMETVVTAKANDDRSRIVKLAFLLLALVLEIGLIKKIASIPEPPHPFPDDMYEINNSSTSQTTSTADANSTPHVRRVELPPVVPSTMVNFVTQWLYPKFTQLTRGQLKSCKLDDFVIDAIQNYVIRLPPMFVGLMDPRRATPNIAPPKPTTQ
jgi:hypothetical protein